MKRLLAAACLTVLALGSTPAWAGDWMENYVGMGTDSDRDSACSAAESNARMTGAAACMARMGHKTDDSVDCRCSTIQNGDGSIYMCTAQLKVYCGK